MFQIRLQSCLRGDAKRHHALFYFIHPARWWRQSHAETGTERFHSYLITSRPQPYNSFSFSCSSSRGSSPFWSSEKQASVEMGAFLPCLCIQMRVHMHDCVARRAVRWNRCELCPRWHPDAPSVNRAWVWMSRAVGRGQPNRKIISLVSSDCHIRLRLMWGDC